LPAIQRAKQNRAESGKAVKMKILIEKARAAML